MKNYRLLLIAIILHVVTACVFFPSSTENEISVRELVEWMERSEEIVILDVRNPEELEGELGHIDGAINIPINELEKQLTVLNESKKKRIAVICRSGNRSRNGTEILVQNGFAAYNVKGGMRAYRKMN